MRQVTLIVRHYPVKPAYALALIGVAGVDKVTVDEPVVYLLT